MRNGCRRRLVRYGDGFHEFWHVIRLRDGRDGRINRQAPARWDKTRVGAGRARREITASATIAFSLVKRLPVRPPMNSRLSLPGRKGSLLPSGLAGDSRPPALRAGSNQKGVPSRSYGTGLEEGYFSPGRTAGSEKRAPSARPGESDRPISGEGRELMGRASPYAGDRNTPGVTAQRKQRRPQKYATF